MRNVQDFRSKAHARLSSKDEEFVLSRVPLIGPPEGLVRLAILNTPQEHWVELCKKRSITHTGRKGPYFNMTPSGVGDLIRNCDWEHYQHSGIKSPAVGFIARFSTYTIGFMTVAHISTVPEEATLVFEDPQNTGFVEAVWENTQPGIPVDFAVITLVELATTGDLLVFDVHPGDPVSPSRIPREWSGFDDTTLKHRRFDRKNAQIQQPLAKELGVEWVKIRQKT